MPPENVLFLLLACLPLVAGANLLIIARSRREVAERAEVRRRAWAKMDAFRAAGRERTLMMDRAEIGVVQPARPPLC